MIVRSTDHVAIPVQRYHYLTVLETTKTITPFISDANWYRTNKFIFACVYLMNLGAR